MEKKTSYAVLQYHRRYYILTRRFRKGMLHKLGIGKGNYEPEGTYLTNTGQIKHNHICNLAEQGTAA